MRHLTPILILTVALSLVLAETASAKPGEGQRGRRGANAGERGGPRGGGPRGGGPLLGAIDQDRDGDLSASEIAQASANLAKLDTDGDGVVTRRELGRAGGGDQARGPRGERRQGKQAGAREKGAKAGPGQGKGKQGRNPEAMLKRADADGDGAISKSEAPERMLQNWDRVDGNGDGKIDQAEQAKMVERMQARMQGGGRRAKN
ncbi:EF hand [Planctomycetes bacterium MalM25]|nr:EF hand [Planctomycetes bacterium MalM25]